MVKTYIVCDVSPILEQGNEHNVVYMREISSAEVQKVGTAQQEWEDMVTANQPYIRRAIKKGRSLEHLFDGCPYSSEQILSKWRETERGRLAGLYLVHDNLSPMNRGRTYNEIPPAWEKIELPSTQIGAETTLEDFLKEKHYWKLD